MKDELRKVEYTLEDSENAGLMDYEKESEREEITKTRKGLFHRWGDEIQIDNGKFYPVTFGIVEDSQTHQIYHIVPKRIKFLPSENK
ncbi:hypothetical protein [Bacteroides caecimuris]|uniref:hypothetical protein n=1 Tax=Bacteroides caecimuris TaxID=1796613 RepID=UPI00265944D8|nr:hypothetical protein [Bacteroides caecimuris]